MMFIIFDIDGNVKRKGGCPPKMFSMQVHEGEFIIEDEANDVTQRVVFDGMDEQGRPINPRVVDKTPAEIEAARPKYVEIPEEQQPAKITKGELKALLNRIENLELRIEKN